MSVRRLTRKHSSVSALIEKERSSSSVENLTPAQEDEITQPNSANVASDVVHEEPSNENRGDTDIEPGTDVEDDAEIDETSPVPLLPTLSKQKTIILKENELESVPSSGPLRMSSRLMSMKRKGKVVMLRELTHDFEFNAGDILTVRGEEDDFYVCRVLEDVPVLAKSFMVAWYNRVSPNLYEVSVWLCKVSCPRLPSLTLGF